MKRSRFLVLCLAILSFTALIFTACGGTKYTVSYGVQSVLMGSVYCRNADGVDVAVGEEVKEGTDLTFIATENEGYSFEGWYAGETKVSNEDVYSLTLTGDVSLVAKYSVLSYTLSFSTEDVSRGTVSAFSCESGDSVSYGDIVELSAVAKQGYEFLGWYMGETNYSTNAELSFEMLAGDVTLVARFMPKFYTLIYGANDSEFGSSEVYKVIDDIPEAEPIVSNSTVSYGMRLKAIATAEVGYRFVGWFVGGEETAKSTELTYEFTMPYNALTLEARFESAIFTLNYSTENQDLGTVSGSVNSGSLVVYGETVTLTATPVAGYKFIGWFADGEETAKSTDLTYEFPMPLNALNLVARFDKESYLLTFTADSERGEVSGSVNSNTLVAYQTSVSVTATEKTGYDFIGWFIAGEENPKTTEYTYEFTMPYNALTLEAKFVPEKRTITYFDGLDIIKTSIVDYGTKFDNYQPIRLNSGDVFEDWCTDATLQTLYNPDTLVTDNIKLYSKWEEVTPVYEIEFVDADGAVINTQEIIEGENIINRPAASMVKVKAGYKFVKWVYVNSEGVETDLKEDTKVTSDMTIMPYCEIIKLKVNFYENDADYRTSKVYATYEVDYGKTVASPTSPTSDTQLFVKWVYCDDITLAFDFESIITEDVNLIAEWVNKPAQTVTITFVDEDGTTIDTKIFEEGAVITTPNPLKEGYDFVKWTYKVKDKDVVLESDATAETNLTIKAVFAIKTFTVTFKNDDGKTLDTQKIDYNKDATPPTAEKVGYTLEGWDKDYTKITEDVTITAIYKINSYDVTFIGFGGETFATQSVEHGAFVPVPETPEVEGFTFSGWFKDEACETPFVFTDAIISDGVVAYAKFEENVTRTFTVVFKVNGTPISTQTVIEGGSAIVPGNPSVTGYNFTGWSVEESEYVSVTQDLEITAIFEKKEYTVKFFAMDGVTLIGEFKVKYEKYASDYKEYADLDIPTIENKTHHGWDKDVETLKITKDTNFVAVYISEEVKVTFMVDGTKYLEVTIEKGSYVNIPSSPSKAGYICKYWYTTDETKNFDFSSEIVTEDITLNAYFTKIADICIVTFVGLDGNTYGNVQLIKKGNKATEPAYDNGTLNDINYIWCLEGESEAFDFSTAITEDVILYVRVAE